MQRRNHNADDAAAEQALFRERFWSDHDLLRDRCIVPGTPVAKLLLLGLLTKIGRNRTHWDARIDSLRVMCNGASASTIRAAMRELRIAGLADFRALRRDEKGWLRCHVSRANLPDWDSTAIPESGTEPSAFRNVRDEKLTGTPMESVPDVSAFRNDTTYDPQQDPQRLPQHTPVACVDGEPDWFVIEAEFIARWNATPGVPHHSQHALGSRLAPLFREVWPDESWRDRAERAMRKFPLKNGAVISLRKFLQPETIDEILGGVHDFTKSTNHRSSPASGSGVTYDPNSADDPRGGF